MARVQSADTGFNPSTLPKAIGKLFELNNYNVEYSKHIRGAEIDIVATPKATQFTPTVYIEATIQNVGNTKYGKDLTKFALVRQIDPLCVCLSVSNTGFTPEVKERATATRIDTLTYVELFRKFERFYPYAEQITMDHTLVDFESTYEEPFFGDGKGEDRASEWLDQWRTSDDPATRWLIILGEYGTGKTALTRILQYRWLQAYKADPDRPITLRIELRNFSRQFDARTLIHHFLDHNDLSHIPIDFVFHLLRNGRLILLLDGYDEMAQFLNPRERRACLAALAELAKDGARGILTSRPNYFTEAEELRVFEALYAMIQENRYFIGRTERAHFEEEMAVDSLLERYVLDRYERYLRDLTINQTEALVRRKLADDSLGQTVVLSLLHRIYRAEPDGSRHALSGKPVIIAYLFELIDELRSDEAASTPGELTEWQIYRMIVDRLMLRDQQRSPLDPRRRRRCLQHLAITLSRRDSAIASEGSFFEIIDQEFRTDLRLMDAEERRHRREELFEDLRSSSTLTRSEIGSGWRFSHNTLREYLAVEFFVHTINTQTPVIINIPITPVMRSFVASVPPEELEAVLTRFQALWRQRRERPGIGTYLTLFWEAIAKLTKLRGRTFSSFVAGDDRGVIPLDGVSIMIAEFNEKVLSAKKITIDGHDTEFSEATFRALDLTGSNFAGATLDSTLFIECNLTRVDFTNALLFECDFSGSDVTEANFVGLDPDSTFFLQLGNGQIRQLSGKSAVGYLRFQGANTDPVEDYYCYQHHPKFSIVCKICEPLTAQANSQLRGLTQRGEANKDPPFARAFVQYLQRHGLVEISQRQLVSATPLGRNLLPELTEHEKMPEVIRNFLRDN